MEVLNPNCPLPPSGHHGPWQYQKPVSTSLCDKKSRGHLMSYILLSLQDESPGHLIDLDVTYQTIKEQKL